MAVTHTPVSVKVIASESPLSNEERARMDAYWRAANYLSVGQIYLLSNPLLREPLKIDHIKPRLLGHWGTTPGLNFIYVHINRVIKKFDLNANYIPTISSPKRACSASSSNFPFLAGFPVTWLRRRQARSTRVESWATPSL